MASRVVCPANCRRISELTLPTHHMGCLACPTRVVGNSRVLLGLCKIYSPRAVATQGCSRVRLTFHQSFGSKSLRVHQMGVLTVCPALPNKHSDGTVNLGLER